MSFIINNGDQDPSILINGFGEGYGDTGDHFAVTDQGEVIYTTVQEGYEEGIQWLHQLVEEKLVDPEAFTQEWSTSVSYTHLDVYKRQVEGRWICKIKFHRGVEFKFASK